MYDRTFYSWAWFNWFRVAERRSWGLRATAWNRAHRQIWRQKFSSWNPCTIAPWLLSTCVLSTSSIMTAIMIISSAKSRMQTITNAVRRTPTMLFDLVQTYKGWKGYYVNCTLVSGLSSDTVSWSVYTLIWLWCGLESSNWLGSWWTCCWHWVA